MVEKERRGGIYHTIPWFAKVNNKYMNVYKKDKEPSYLMYWYAKNLYGQPMSEKLPTDNFEWEEITSKFDAKNMIKIMIMDIYLKKLLNILRNYKNMQWSIVFTRKS